MSAPTPASRPPGVTDPFRLATAVRDAAVTPPSVEGDLVIGHLDAACDVLLAATASEGLRHVDELFMRDLVATLEQVGAPGTLLVVHRATGRPTRGDRRFWRDLEARLVGAQPRLVDLVVVGPTAAWSARTGSRPSRHRPDA